jgi:hypothetical protein
MLNDFHVDPSGLFVYIADTSLLAFTPAIIVYSTLANRAYRVISNSHSLLGHSLFLKFNVTPPSPRNNSTHHEIRFGPFGLKIHADSIALDRTGSTLYFGALTGTSLFSISTSHLLHYVNKVEEGGKDLKAELDYSITSNLREVITNKPATDGISIDNAGNIWMTAVEHSSICVAMVLSS